MEDKKNAVRGFLAGIAAGAAVGYIIGKRKNTGQNNLIPHTLVSTLTEVALDKGIEALSELRQRYAAKLEAAE